MLLLYLLSNCFLVNKKFFLPVFLLIQVVFLQIASHYPEYIETYYSKGIYPFISGISRSLLGKIPFSVGDILYGLLILYVLYWLKKNWNTSTKKGKFLAFLNLVSVIYFLFHLLWALNYYREPLHQKMNLKTEYTSTELIEFTKKLITKSNQVHLLITNDSTKKVVVPYQTNQIYELSLNGYRNLSQSEIYFNYQKPSIKSSLISLPLTYMGFSGYLNPFTNEAQVNNLPPAYNLPATTCHEMAHQIGYASESECNFIGFLAASYNSDLYFKYSGYTYALRYCLGNIGAKDEKLLENLLKTINPGILKNYEESENFYLSHKTFIDKGFEIFYDHFLKMNQQKDGMESYSKFINLLINYYKAKQL